MTRTQARKIVESILDDLTDRRGLAGEWYQIDEDIQEEIKTEWENIIIQGAGEC